MRKNIIFQYSCCLFLGLSFSSYTIAQERKEIAVDTLKIKEIELGSTLDYIRFNKSARIEANDFIKNNPKVFYETDQQKMLLKKTEEDELGFTHYRYGQSYLGIPIEDADYWIHSKDGVLTTANGIIVEMPKTLMNTTSLNKDKAVERIKYHESSKKSKINIDDRDYHSQLLWVSKDKDTTGTVKDPYYLAYKIENKKTAYTAYVSASSGNITYDYYAVNHCQSPVNFNSYYYGTKALTTNLQGGLYRMQDICPSVCANLNKNIQITDENDNVITNTSNSWTTDLQRKAATSQWATSNTYNYFCEKHNWKGYDNNNSLLTVKLLPLDEARWFATGTMNIGNRNSNISTPYCSQDIIAHEFTHGFVITNIGNTAACKSGSGPAPYISCQATSLNEAVADMLGIAVEYYALPTSANFLIGENVVPSGFRDVSNPKSKGFPNCIKSPANPAPTNWSNAVGEPMTYNNGAIATFWFHLLCNGGSGNVDDKPTNPAYTVSSIGIDKAAKIVVRALRYYGFSGIGFDQFRRATIEAAKDLYGNCSSELLQTAAAWRAVGLDEFFNYGPSFDLCGDFGGIPSKHEIYYAQNTMNMPAASCTTQNLVVKSGSTLVVTSANSVVLKPGFRAEAGSRFKATATSCLTQSLRQGSKSEENFSIHENENIFSNAWSVAPNPSQESDLHIHFPKDKIITKISLTDVQGKIIQKEVKFQQLDNFASFNTDLHKGIYFINITTQDGEHKTLKLIKL